MNNRKLIVCDIDGTLVPEGHGLSKLTIKTIKKLNSEGHIVVLATGRPLRIVMDFYNTLNLDTPVICYNGALLIHPKQKDFPIYSKTFDKNVLKTISSLSSNIIKDSFCENLQNLYTQSFDELINFYFDYEDKPCIKGKIYDVLDNDVFNCCLRYNYKNLDEFKEIVEANSPYKVRLWNTPGYCELFNPGADKGSCLAHIIDYYDFNKNDVIAFGDGENDRTMLELAGHSFCMKNSKSPSLKNDFANTEFTSIEDGVVKELIKNMN